MCVADGTGVYLTVQVCVYLTVQVCVADGAGECVPERDDVTRFAPDVPAAVEGRGVLEGPARAGDHPAGGPHQLRYVTTRYKTSGVHFSV